MFGRERAVSRLYDWFLGLILIANIGGFVFSLAVMRRVIPVEGIAQLGATPLAVVLVFFVLFIIARKVVRRDAQIPVAVTGGRRWVYLTLVVLGLGVCLASANIPVLLEPGAWKENRIGMDGAEYWYYLDHFKQAATALDYEMQQRMIQLVPMLGALFLGGVFQGYVAVDRLAPGAIVRAIFAPWRFLWPKRSDPDDRLDAYAADD